MRFPEYADVRPNNNVFVDVHVPLEEDLNACRPKAVGIEHHAGHWPLSAVIVATQERTSPLASRSANRAGVICRLEEKRSALGLVASATFDTYVRFAPGR